MTLARACCCGSVCQNPTGSTSLSATRHIEVDLPILPGFTGTDTVEWYAYFFFQFLGTSLTAVLSSIRVRYHRYQNLSYGGSLAFAQDRKIDITMTPAGGSIACNGAGSNVCGECGGTTVHRYDPDISLPYYSGGTQVGSLTLNAYTNTAGGSTPSVDWVGLSIQSDDQTLYPQTGGVLCPFPILHTYGWDGSSWIQPSSSTTINPLRVWSDLSGSGPSNICDPIDQVLGQVGSSSPFNASGFGATAYGGAGLFPEQCVQNLCPGGKRYLEAKGWTFTTDIATASIT